MTKPVVGYYLAYRYARVNIMYIVCLPQQSKYVTLGLL